MLLISLWLHLTLLLLVVAKVHFDRPEEEELPPPSTVAMVFQGGQPEGPALPHPEPNVAAPIEPPAPPPVPTPQAAIAPPTPAPPTPQAAPTPTPLPLPPPPPPAAAAEIPLPRPPPPVAMVIPRPVLPPPHRTPPPSAAPSRPPAFPTPMNFSFSQPTPQTRAPARTSSRAAPNTLDFSLAPRQGATDNSPFSRVAGAHVGPDWRNELSAWVRSHAYYPTQAAMNDEDGDVTVQVVANPNGHVTSVEMRSRSGSQWLDMALMALFRDANLPPLHDDEGITFNFTMHYILIRMR